MDQKGVKEAPLRPFQGEIMKGKTLFVRPDTDKKTLWERFKYFFKYKLNVRLKEKEQELIAPVMNHPKRKITFEYINGWCFLAITLGLALELLSSHRPFFQGFGIAVLVGWSEFYIPWLIRLIK